MKKLLFLALVLSGSAYAALPPLAQGIREIDAIVTDPELYQLLGSSEAIQQVIKTEGGYAVLTRNYYLRVNVKYIPNQLIGPASFELRFSQPIDLRSCQDQCSLDE
jgi:hypothetical protein